MVGHKLVNGVLAVLLLVSLSACAANTGNVAEAGLLNAQKIAQALVIPTWEQVNANGFGDPKELEVSALETFNGYLYAGSYNVVEPLVIFDGARIFRSPDGVTWTAVTYHGNPYSAVEGAS